MKRQSTEMIPEMSQMLKLAKIFKASISMLKENKLAEQWDPASFQPVVCVWGPSGALLSSPVWGSFLYSLLLLFTHSDGTQTAVVS